METIFENKQDWKDFIAGLKNVKIKTDKEKIRAALVESIKRSIPNERFGIMFSGGIDSTFIALVCKQLKKDFICYCVGIENSEDLVEAKKVAKELNLKLKAKLFTLEGAEEIIKNTVKILDEDDVMKVGVASVVYAAIQLAQKDKINHFFTGLGSEEIFAGYQRHELAKDINEECWNGLFRMHDRDISRDMKIANHFNSKLLTPFIDKEVIINAMNISADRKINNSQNKLILREIAMDSGLKKEFAQRKKRAAQYGSKFDRAILRIAKRKGFKYKKDYLRSLLK